MTLSKSPKVINSFMSDILEKIVAVKKQELAAAQLRADYSSMRHLAEQSLSLDACDLKPRDFVRAIKQKIASGQAAVIAEIKKASPSSRLNSRSDTRCNAHSIRADSRRRESRGWALHCSRLLEKTLCSLRSSRLGSRITAAGTGRTASARPRRFQTSRAA